MRLASKIFAASALILLVLVGVAIWSLLAVNRLVEVHREAVTLSLPALRIETALRDSVRNLVRLEGRALVLGDDTYAAMWDERASRTATDFEVLHAFLTTEEELDRYREAMATFMTYRRLVRAERGMLARGNREGALRLSEGESRAASEQADTALDRLIAATNTALERSQAGAAELERRTWNATLLALLASLVVALATTGLLALRMTRSLRRLSAATAQLAEGSFARPLPVESTDEIGDLARSFNRMAERLREVDLLKEEFFSHVSHDLRTPLTSVREATQLLLERVPGPLAPKQERLVQIIRASAERVLGLVSQILEFSRLRARLLPLEHRWVNLEKVVARGLDELRPQAEERGIQVERSTSGSDFGVLGDEDRLLRVVVNLAGNAIKFTLSGGSIAVRLADRGAEVELVVEDSGVGIPPEALPGIFDPYHQAHRGQPGSGLGLAIVRGLVEAHGGQVSVQSEEGKGTRFTVRLPRQGGSDRPAEHPAKPRSPAP